MCAQDLFKLVAAQLSGPDWIDSIALLIQAPDGPMAGTSEIHRPGAPSVVVRHYMFAIFCRLNNRVGSDTHQIVPGVNRNDIQVNLGPLPGSPDAADMMQPTLFKEGFEADA